MGGDGIFFFYCGISVYSCAATALFYDAFTPFYEIFSDVRVGALTDGLEGIKPD